MEERDWRSTNFFFCLPPIVELLVGVEWHSCLTVALPQPLLRITCSMFGSEAHTVLDSTLVEVSND